MSLCPLQPPGVLAGSRVLAGRGSPGVGQAVPRAADPLSKPAAGLELGSGPTAVGGMWPPKPGVFVGASVPEGLALGCRMGGLHAELWGDCHVCKREEKGSFLARFPF